VEDVPLSIPLSDGGVWEPKNLGDSYDGIVSLRDALVLSKNVPTVRLAQSVGYPTVAAFARRAGLRDLPSQPSLALGAGAVSPLELTAAYTIFAAAGRRVEPRLVASVETLDGRVLWRGGTRATPVLDPPVAFLVTEALRDALVRGSGARVRRAGFRGTAAGKTGTTNDGTDVWFVGYTPDVVAGVWIGFDEPRPITRNAVAGRLAAPVFGRLMASVAGGGGRPRGFSVPRGVVTREVDPATGLVLTAGCAPLWQEPHREFFLEGWEPAAYCPGVEEPPVHGFWTEREGGLGTRALAREDGGVAGLPRVTKAAERPPR
jgi:penicillin-binding protein 1A